MDIWSVASAPVREDIVELLWCFDVVLDSRTLLRIYVYDNHDRELHGSVNTHKMSMVY